jgi:Dockerin type I domain
VGNFPLAPTSLQMHKIYLLLFALFLFSQNLDAQVDTVPPVLVCKQWPSINLAPQCYTTLWAIDMVDSVYDDDTQPVQLGIRKRCTGSGFSQQNHIEFTANEYGAQPIEVWAKDNSGNTTVCFTTVLVGDSNGNCDPGFTMRFVTPLEAGIDSIFIDVKGSNCLLDSFEYQLFAYNSESFPPFLQGIYSEFSSVSRAVGSNFTVTPVKNNRPLNGVSTYDLALISKHILGIEPFDSPYKIIAADANQDGKVTTFDIIILRRLILGLSDTLPNGKSWRFVPYEYVFPNPNNPFYPLFPEKSVVPNTADPAPADFMFKGVKIGDVNYSADPN